jgi:thiamine-phosphate pyrophosphorylase
MSHAEHTVLRIIDANVNRAREALRVMEDYARLGLDDASLSAAIKETRHTLAQAVIQFERRALSSAVGASGEESTPSCTSSPHNTGGTRTSSEAAAFLSAHRDIVGDVGREVTTPSEYQRSDAMHVAVAAAKRLSEALRTVEEYAKTLDPAFAAAIEKLRYEGYELERRLTLTGRAGERFGHVRLYVIITESLCSGDWLATAEAALRGGADCLQLREKDLPDRDLLDRARRLAKLCHDHGTMFIVNDRPDVAALSGADGVHLGQDDLPVAAARRMLPSRCIIGVSTHTPEQLAAAVADAPDYIAVGPMFSSTTKPQDYIAGPDALAAARRVTSLPLAAIGGIDERNATEVLAAGADCLCVCSGIISRQDVTAATSALRALIEQSACRSVPRA